MRTLLIDNHDSFTYNLFQYLAASNAEAPFVVKNDEMRWEEVEKLGFDNIVISPGPGRPQRASDLGLSADALRHASVPVLGVCLGHQAIAHFCGATVDLAVRPMHGRLDRISHAQRDLFRGIPDRFEAVRYHSLAVTQLPQSLQATAWTSDGTLMALRHVTRPWWGVQFHPESICTEYGARLLRNFRELTEEWRTAKPRRATMGSFLSGPELDPAPAPDRAPRLLVHAQCVDTLAAAQEVFGEAFGEAETSFWLDSSLADSGRARFSFMGDATGPGAQVLSYRAATRELLIRRGDAAERRQQSVFDYLQQSLATRRPVEPALPFDFTGGYVGYFGYELKAELGGDAAHETATPDAVWILVDRFIAFDHAELQAWVVCIDAHELKPENRDWMRRMRTLLAQPREAPAASHLHQEAAQEVRSLAWRTDLAAYRELIVRCQQEILQGETYEVCLTNRLQGDGRLDALAVYRALRAANPAPFAAFLRAGGVTVLCASPELFLRITGDRTVDSRPIKGTAPRGATPQEDQEIAARLAQDEKTRAENLMIVDLLRNDLNRVCEIDSVHVPQLFHVESYATVHQLVSTIRGRLREDRSVVDCVRAAFPGGSMTGAPKERTMRILDGLEGAARGIYSGSLGYLSFGGTAQLNIVIRSIVVTADGISIGTGGAIVAMSDPDAEVDEIVLKTRALVDVLRRCGASIEPVGANDAKRPHDTHDG
ncbi:MAG: aminodeoxychorismate synthase component I [Variovorax sp.]